MINASCEWFKVFLALGVRKVGFLIALIFSIYIKFLNLLFLNLLDKFTTILLTLLSISKTLLFLSLNAFEVESDNLIVFNNKINNAAILLKSWIKH